MVHGPWFALSTSESKKMTGMVLLMEEFMKQFFNNKKWILSTALLFALGSQYYFSVSSKNFGEIEMALTAEEQLTTDMAAILTKYKEAAKKETGPVKKDEAAPARPAIAAGQTGAGIVAPSATACNDCVTFTKKRAEEIEKALKELAELKEKDKKTKDDAEKEKAKLAAETPEEKKLRLKEEELERKKSALEKKIAREKKAKETREKEFKLNMELASLECGSKVTCLVEKFKEHLTDAKDGKISDALASAMFKKYVDPKLSALIKVNPEGAASALEGIMSDIPSDYFTIKHAALQSVKDATKSKASAINQLYRNNLFTEANKQDQDLRKASDLYHKHITTGLESSEDTLTLAYIQEKYLPEMQAIFGKISDTMGSRSFFDSTQKDNSGNSTSAANSRFQHGRGTGQQVQQQRGSTPTVQSTQNQGVQFNQQRQGTSNRGRGSY